jgi:hypothetical protein
MNEKVAYKFTCKKCGDHNLIATHVWSILAGVKSERWQEWGPLKDNHTWHYEFKEKVGKNEDDEVQPGDPGEFAEDESASEPEEYEIYEAHIDRESDEFYVNCANCDREVKFGWSLPDRRGFILPVEFSDFVAVESWPDPKYIHTWQKNGWMHVYTR